MGTILEEIKYHDLRFEEIVGRGSFGVVYRAKWKGQTVAVKRAETETEIQSFRIEARQLQRVSHPNVITIFGVCSDDTTNPLCLIMEYAECGSLYQLLHGSENIPQYSLAHAISWLAQCARGVSYLHAMKPKPLIHRDLKPPNILLSDAGRKCKLCDFGTACEARTYLTNNRGSAAWMAPEVFESNKYTEKCDVFSFGIIIWEVLTRKRPYDEIGGNIYRIMWAIHRGIRPPLIRGCPVILETLMTKCWAKEPYDRPKMVYVVKILDRVLAHLKGANLPIRWKKTSRDLSQVRAIQERNAENTTNNQFTGRVTDTVLQAPEQEKTTTPEKKSSPDQAYHTNTLNILPVVEAQAEPYVRYTTLHEHTSEPVLEEDDFAPRYNYSSTLEFGSSGNVSLDDHGFVEYNNISSQTPMLMTSSPVQRPLTLDFIRPSSSGVRFSFNPNIQIDVRASPAVRRVQSLTFEMSSPTGGSTVAASPTTTVIQRHYSFRSDPDEYSYTEDAATDDDDTCQSDSNTFPSHTLWAR